MENIKNFIQSGKSYLGIEFGSTRIKAVLIGENCEILASGIHDWENRLVDGVWTYYRDDILNGMSDCYADLKKNVSEQYGVKLTKIASIGLSAMMHGYIALNEKDEFLTNFRTWRNTSTGEAAEQLSELFGFNIPLRWTVSHFYQAILNKEDHVNDIKRLTTLAGCVHYLLSGNFVLGIGDASGVFPIDEATKYYDRVMLDKLNDLTDKAGIKVRFEDIVPSVLSAGEVAGSLTSAGALLLDKDGELEAGAVMCPPEGDAGTGMVATNSILKRTGNVSAGTSIFAMTVLERPLKYFHREIDVVTTPTGSPVAMIHCNNCTSELNNWANMFVEFCNQCGVSMSRGKALDIMFDMASKADADCGGAVTCNYLSGEHITGFEEGRPLVLRQPNANFDLRNFARASIYSSVATLKIGMDILKDEEQIAVDRMIGHGGFFKADFGISAMADSLSIPVSVMTTSGEGGAWGMAILAMYCVAKQQGETLEDYLANKVFASADIKTAEPTEAGVKGFADYLVKYKNLLKVENTAVQVL